MTCISASRRHRTLELEAFAEKSPRNRVAVGLIPRSSSGPLSASGSSALAWRQLHPDIDTSPPTRPLPEVPGPRRVSFFTIHHPPELRSPVTLQLQSIRPPQPHHADMSRHPAREGRPPTCSKGAPPRDERPHAQIRSITPRPSPGAAKLFFEDVISAALLSPGNTSPAAGRLGD